MVTCKGRPFPRRQPVRERPVGLVRPHCALRTVGLAACPGLVRTRAAALSEAARLSVIDISVATTAETSVVDVGAASSRLSNVTVDAAHSCLSDIDVSAAHPRLSIITVRFAAHPRLSDISVGAAHPWGGNL